MAAASSNENFAIVEWLGIQHDEFGKKIRIVPMSWITNMNSKTMCYFPSHSYKNSKDFVEANAWAKKYWSLYDVRILATTESYNEAEQYLKVALTMTDNNNDLESINSPENFLSSDTKFGYLPRFREQGVPPKKELEIDTLNLDFSELMSPERRREPSARETGLDLISVYPKKDYTPIIDKTSTNCKVKRGAHYQAAVLDEIKNRYATFSDLDEINGNTIISTIKKVMRTELQKETIDVKKLCIEGFSYIHYQIDHLADVIEKSRKSTEYRNVSDVKLPRIKRESKESKNHALDDSGASSIANLPFDSHDDLKKFEVRLEKSEDYKELITRMMQAWFGGSTPLVSAQSFLNELMTKKLQSKYSNTGVGEKKHSFVKLQILNSIYTNNMMSKYPTLNELQVTQVIGIALSRAGFAYRNQNQPDHPKIPTNVINQRIRRKEEPEQKSNEMSTMYLHDDRPTRSRSHTRFYSKRTEKDRSNSRSSRQDHRGMPKLHYHQTHNYSSNKYEE